MGRPETDEEKHLRIATQVIHSQMVRLRQHPLSPAMHKDISNVMRMLTRWGRVDAFHHQPPKGSKFERRVKQLSTARFALKIAGDLGESQHLTESLRLAVANLQDVAGAEINRLKAVRLDD